MARFRKGISVILFAALFVYLIGVLVKVIHNWPGVRTAHEVPAAYADFFSARSLASVVPAKSTSIFSHRNSVSRWDYGDYELLLSSVAVSPSFSLKTDLRLSADSKGFGLVPGTSEFQLGKMSALFNMNPGSDNKVALLHIDGDSVSDSGFGDSLRVFNIKLADLNFYFKGNSQVELCVENNGEEDIPEEKFLPLTLVFRKSSSRLFICLISEKEGKSFIPKKELYALIMSKDPD